MGDSNIVHMIFNIQFRLKNSDFVIIITLIYYIDFREEGR